MKEIELTRGKVAIVDDDDYEYLRQYKWQFNSDGYAVRRQYYGKINGKYVQKGIFMHRIVNKTPGGMQTDHINGNKLDNRKENLRSCTYSENARNKGLYKNNKFGFKGVYTKGGENIYATIQTNGIPRHLGTFHTVEDAAKAYNEAAIKYHGEFAKLNFI